MTNDARRPLSERSANIARKRPSAAAFAAVGCAATPRCSARSGLPSGWQEGAFDLAHEASAQPQAIDGTSSSGAGGSDVSADQSALRGLFQSMNDAWNSGSGSGFAAPFSSDADFVAFEGTRLKGRAQITAFHQNVFDTVMKGSPHRR